MSTATDEARALAGGAKGLECYALLAELAANASTTDEREALKWAIEEIDRHAEALACLRLVVDEMGIGPWMHERDQDGEPCPEDDTCRCPKVARINAALRR